MAKRKILRKGMIIALTVTTLAAGSTVHADDSEPGDRGIGEFIAGVIDTEKAQRWIAEIRRLLQAYAQHDPTAPIVQMPVSH